MSSIFSIRKEDINRLSTDNCVNLFGNILHADARRIKLSISKVHFSTITIPDGGIDASIEDGISEQGDLIIDAESFYQIKAGESFEPWQEAVIKQELLGNRESKKENLGSEVRRCFERNGTYILICMKVQLTTERKNKAEENLIKILQQCGISNPKVKVFDQEKIIHIIQSFPSLVLHVTGKEKPIFSSFADWENTVEMQKSLVLGAKQDEFIKSVRDLLFDDSEAIHLNVSGEAGVGKTRLILEATRDPFLSPLVIYCYSPKEFLTSALLSEIVRDVNLQCILIIDECDLVERLKIWDRLSNLGSRIKLITIYNEFRRSDGTTKQLEAPNLNDDKIREIIQTYGVDNIIAGQLSSLCGGIPRVAHVVGWDVQNNPTEILRGGQDAFDIFERYINQGEDPNSEHVRQRKRILLTISLFKKFGNNKFFADEFNAIHQLIQKIDSNITSSIFQEHVKELQKKKILQGEETLYVSPKALHLWLWMTWWDQYSGSINFEDLVNNLPPKLREWFFAMFQYAANSEVTTSIVKGLFEKDGPLYNSESIKTSLGAQFFQSLAFVDPTAATEYLERTMGKWPLDELKKFETGRREVIYGLERIVFEPDLFTRGGTLLRNLAEAENEAWGNNATGLFTGLFSLGPGYVSITKTPPNMRLKLLKETLCSESESKRNLGLKACESALQTLHFTRSSGLPGDELRTDQKGWEPKTHEEWQKAYEEVIELLVEKIKTFPKNDQKRGAGIVFSSARGLLKAFPNIGEYLIKKLSELQEFLDKESTLKNIIEILEFEKDELNPTIKSQLEKLRDDITGTDYNALMKRYVGMNIMMDLAIKDHEAVREEKIKELAKKSQDSSKLQTQLDWLVTLQAKYGYVFGQELAKFDTEHVLLPMILEAQRNAKDDGSGFFLSGYLLTIFEKDPKKWNKIMLEIAKDEKLIRYFSELAWRSGITDEIGQLILDLTKSNKIKVNELSQFYLGGVVNKLSSETVTKWIEYMLDTNDQKVIFSAIALYDSFFVHRKEKSLDPELTMRLLTNDAFLGDKKTLPYDTMVDYYWKEIGLRFIEQYPKRSLKLADKMLESMGNDSTIVSSHSQTLEVLDKISSDFPDETWELVTKYIDLPFDKRGFAIINWMRGGLFEKSHSFLEHVDFTKIFDWIDHDPHKRAPYIAEHAKPELTPTSLARELLVRYGDDESVQKSLAANFFTGGFSGPGSSYYQKRQDEILAYKKTEENENVKNWIDFYVKCLDEDIQRERLREEREF